MVDVDYLEQKKAEAREVVERIGQFVNNFSYDTDAKTFYESLIRQHRTLQSNVIRLMLDVIKRYADLEWMDARNQHAVEACKKVKAFLNSADIYLPTI